MVLYGITLFPFVEDLRAADLGLIAVLYMDNAASDGLVHGSIQDSLWNKISK